MLTESKIRNAAPGWYDSNYCEPSDIREIQQHGCPSGAYIYDKALETMADHGDEVLAYIRKTSGKLPNPPQDISWSDLAEFYLSHAVELWANQFEV